LRPFPAGGGLIRFFQVLEFEEKDLLEFLQKAIRHTPAAAFPRPKTLVLVVLSRGDFPSDQLDEKQNGSTFSNWTTKTGAWGRASMAGQGGANTGGFSTKFETST
jgi:hypothetical protein